MSLVMLIGDAPNQIALCHKVLESGCDLSGVVVSKNRLAARPGVSSLGNRVAGRIVGRPFVRAWQQMLAGYAESYPTLPPVRTLAVSEINAPETAAFLKRAQARLVGVSGTNLLRPALIESARSQGGIVNLHTGLSPYLKGGPNCTNWCLARGDFALIGNSVMWIDAGVDSGNLIATERTVLSGTETLEELHVKVMEHAHALYVDVLQRITAGENVPNVPQDEVGSGRTYGSADWTPRQMLRARLHFVRSFSPQTVTAGAAQVRLVGDRCVGTRPGNG